LQGSNEEPVPQPVGTSLMGQPQYAALPAAEDVFKLPTAEEVFAPPKPFINKIPLVEHFRRGYVEGYGEPWLQRKVDPADPNSKSYEQVLRDTGVFGELDATRRTIFQQLNESVAAGAITALQGIPGVIRGVSEAMTAGLGVPRDLTPQAAFEAFPAGHATGVPFGPTRPGTAQAFANRHIYPVDIDAAIKLGVFGEPTEGAAARAAFAPGAEATPTPPRGPLSYTMPGVPEGPGVDPIHVLARQLNPQVIDNYEALREQRGQLTDWIQSHAGEVTTPEIEFARSYRTKVEQQMRDLAPQYADTYREAQKQLRPAEAAPEAAPTEIRLTDRGRYEVSTPEGVLDAATRTEAEALAARFQRLTPDEATTYEKNTGRNYEEDFLNNQVDTEAANAARAAPAEPPPGFTVTKVGDKYIVRDDAGREVSSAATHDAGVQAARDAAASPEATPVARQVRALAQRAPGIAAETRQRLILAGTPADVATAQARIVQAYYEARAERFGGALGSAQELFDREAIRPEAGGPGRDRGRIVIRGTRKILQLFDKADASTFMHESAHDWLEQVWRDKDHPAATPEFLNDVQTVRDWLGLKEGFALSRRAHEQFAQGFERYLMEGQAPSTRLASVFEKFKNWLTSIYEGLRAPGSRYPINDDIRAVYDRLLSTPSREPVIASERPGARTFAEDARAAADETPAGEAAAKADQVAAQRDRVAEQTLSGEINDGRREARRGSERAGVSEDRPPGEDGTGGSVVAETTSDVGRGGDTTAPESQAPPSGAPFERGTDRLIDKAGNIRIDNLAVPEDVASAIRQTAGEHSGFIESRRGVLSDAETIRLAEELGVDPNVLDRWTVGQAWTAEQIVYARKLLRDSATKVRDAAKRLEARPRDEEALAEYAAARDRHVMIQEVVSGVTAEAGRALRVAFRSLGEEDRHTQTISSLLQRSTGLSPGALRREARLMSASPDPPTVSATLARTRGTPTEMAMEIWINGLVAGPFTHAINLTTNFGVAGLSIAEAAGAASIGSVRRALGGKGGVTWAEVGDRVHGMAEGAVDGLKTAYAIVKDENKIPLARNEAAGQPRLRAVPDVNLFGVNLPLGQIARFPGRLLSAEDEIFKGIAWQQEINVLSRRTALAEGHVGDALAARMNWLRSNPTDGMIAAAEQFAEYQTFQRQLGGFGAGIVRFADSHPILRVILPFIRTPTNIFKYAAERSPLGLASREVRQGLTSGNAAIRDTQMSRMVLGNMVGIGAGYLALQGFITGGGPKDANEQATLRRTGWQPYSINVGGTMISYQRFDPFATVIGLGADLADLAKHAVVGHDDFGKETDIESFANGVVLAGYRNIIDKMSLRGITSTVMAITDPERYGDGFVQGLFGSLVPGILGQTARQLDPYDRKLWDIRDSIYSRIPFLREDLYPKRDLWGEPITAYEFGPVNYAQMNTDPVNLKMAELGMSKAPVEKVIGGVKLSEAQYDEYAKYSGQLAKKLLDGLVTQPSFTANPLGVQAMVIKKVIDGAHAAGKAHVLMESMGTVDDLVKKGLDVRTMYLETGHKPSTH